MPDVYVSEGEGKKAAPVKEQWRELVDKVLREAGERPRKEHYGAYYVRPGIHFLTQQQDEEVVLLLRAHPITNLGWIFLAAIMLLIPTLLQTIGMFEGLGLGGNYLFMGKLTWYLMTAAFIFEKFLNWYYTVFIITNERIVDIDFHNLLYRVITYGNLNHIEEPAMVTGGFVRSLFQYGNVFVTTASETPTIEAIAVPWPHKVVDIISRLSEELEKRRELGQ